uniref:DUF834 domain-containing protein n=1 Tax=Oryza sativa subsp. japonica TaxID=39947 RepID=Q5Z4C5_ORYSJ|nr:hypothetical protein [Oryza sativa Japonica Group]BAD62407.1 hypothetical protein [Oryza sativa Japonica Group]
MDQVHAWPRARVHHVDGPGRPKPIGRLSRAAARPRARPRLTRPAMARRLRARARTTAGDGSASRRWARGAADGEKGEGAVGILTEDGDGETTTGRRPAAENMAATGTGGDGNGVPTTPDHGGATAEGRQDLGKILERLGREIGDRSGEKRPLEAVEVVVARVGGGNGAPVMVWGFGVAAGVRGSAAKPRVAADLCGDG